MRDIAARKFTGAFTQQASLPAEIIRAAMPVLQTRRPHRYDLLPSELEEVAS
ncbi:hypothetical protein [uncultured Ruegeria sp.]|uniref:hypothetical protein n=1 Tax=uncultured Ruegeria sp. TaxID=259304 RepID=UPI002603AEFA|nr:hypothetical protein [uncultured Ruegeria sp.]